MRNLGRSQSISKPSFAAYLSILPCFTSNSIWFAHFSVIQSFFQSMLVLLLVLHAKSSNTFVLFYHYFRCNNAMIVFLLYDHQLSHLNWFQIMHRLVFYFQSSDLTLALDYNRKSRSPNIDPHGTSNCTYQLKSTSKVHLKPLMSTPGQGVLYDQLKGALYDQLKGVLYSQLKVALCVQQSSFETINVHSSAA